jgi:hypothetical protein
LTKAFGRNPITCEGRKTKCRGTKVAEVRREERLNVDIKKCSKKQNKEKKKFFLRDPLRSLRLCL